jgi:hypothetical protein
MGRDDRFHLAVRMFVMLALLTSASLVAVGAAGCGKTTKTTSQPSSTGSQPSSQQGAASTSGPVVLFGNGTQVTQQFSLAKGVALSSIQYSGGSRFKAVMIDSAGRQVDVLADATTNFNGSTATVVSGGQYAISVEAAGPWEIDVTQSLPAAVPQIPLTFTGTGPVATQFFQSTGGNASFLITFAGTGKFKVELLDSSGGAPNVMADVTGAYNSTVTVPLAAGVYYLLDIEGIGPWTVNVQ